jgi:hypothetical protein
MSADIRSLAEARAARAHPTPAVLQAAQRYVVLAEEAIAMAPEIKDLEQRAAVCWISEAWLELAEASLSRD